MALNIPTFMFLLLDDKGNPFKSHAGGLFVYEKYLFVADTDYGLNYFDTSTIESLSSENNFASNGCLYAMKMVNKINIKTLLAKESLSDISFSWCDMPRNEENRVLVGSYVTSGSEYITRSRYVAKFSIDPALNFKLIDCWQNGTGSDSAGDGLPNNTQGMTFSSATGTDIFLASCSGSTAHLKALKLFDKNWTSVVSYVVDETAYIMMLKEQDGIVHIYKPSADGCLGENLHSYDWSKGWTSVTSYIVDGTTYIMLLKAQNGTVHIHKPLVDGRLGSNLHSYDWSAGWTSVTPFIVDGTTYIMLLKKDNGTIHIHKPLADGRLGDNLHSYDWSAGWTSVTPFIVDGTTYIMLLKAQDGTVHIHKPLADGRLGDNLHSYDWSAGWTSVTPFIVDGTTYIMLLKKDNGIVHIHKPLADGRLGDNLHSYDWSEGWSSVIPYIVDGTTYIMLLKEDGTVHIHKPLADGSLGDNLHTYGCSVVKTWLWPYGTEDVHISSSGNIWGCTEHPSSRYVFRGKVSTYTDEI